MIVKNHRVLFCTHIRRLLNERNPEYRDSCTNRHSPVIGSIHSIPLSAIHPMPNNPFQIRDDPAMNELIESVSQFGILVPVEVRPTEFGDYEMISGSRRQHACIAAGLDAVTMCCIGLAGYSFILHKTGTQHLQCFILPLIHIKIINID